MSPDATPERDTAARESSLVRELRGEVPDDWRLTWSDVIVVVLGLMLAVGLALLHLSQA